MTHNTHKTTHSTMPAILPAILTGLFILTACGGGALPNDGKIAPNTQNNACKTNPLAEGCQNHAKSTQFIGQQTGFLSVGARGSDEDTANQEAESNVAPPAPTPVVKKTEPVLEELAKKQTPPTPAPITQEDTYDFAPQTSYSTYSSPAPVRSGSIASGNQAPSPVTTSVLAAYSLTRNTTPANEFLTASKRTVTIIHPLRPEENRDEQHIGLDRGDAPRGDPLRMNLNQAYYDGAKIGGDVGDGIDFFTVNNAVVTGEITYHENGKVDADGRVITSTRYHYAGILSGTDLGAPVATSGVTATWYGSFRTYNTNPVDFELTVGFGTTEQDRTISAFVKDTAWSLVDNYYFLEGTYGTNGLITATVNWGEFTGRNSATPKDGRLKNGTLTGLIGAQGAVGVFISDNGKNAETSDGYAGGFVASASLPEERVTYSDWAESFDDPTTGGVLETPSLRAEVTGEDDGGDDTFTNQFLGNSEYSDTLDETGAGAVTQRGGLTLADDADSGVSFFSNGISLATLTDGSQSFAGLLSGTDLGAPLTDASLVGEWQGQFKSIGGYYFGATPGDNTRVETAVDTDFTLTVTFGGGTGTLSAYVPIDEAGRHFYITGTYNDKGVITGDVRAANFNNIGKPTTTVADDANGNGVLTGLIGVEGAVGAFISNADNYNYAGGFVAAYVAPFVVPDDDNLNLVDYSDWARHQEGLSNTANTVSPSNQFLGTAVGDTELAGAPVSAASKAGGNLVIDGATVGGFSVFTNGTQYYAGILAGTDLGAPVTETDKTVTWSGSFHSIGGYDRDDTLIGGRVDRLTNFDLEITLGVANAGGSIAAFVPATSNSFYRIDGTFGANGYITGNVNFGSFDNDDSTTPLDGRANNGVLTGLIGQKGAIGVFVSNPVDPSVTTGEHNFTFAGGFAVTPPPPLPKYSTFVEHYGSQLPEGRDERAGGSGFLRGLPNTLNTAGLDLSSGLTVGPVVVRLGEVTSGHADFNSGFVVLRDNGNKYRAGLLSDTDLGALLTPDVKAEWSGKAYLIRRAGIGSGDLTLTVDFDAGTINSTTAANLDNNAGSLTVAGRFGSKWGLPDSILGGSVGYASLNAGLIGLIGEAGVLGVFHGGSDQQSAGGFWAKPTEETAGSTYKTEPTLYSHWVTSFTGGVNAGETLQDSGVTARDIQSFEGNYIKLDVSGDIVINKVINKENTLNTLTTTTVRLNENSGEDGYESGFAYASDSDSFERFAGLLPTTDVGGAITAGPAKAIWSGELKGLAAAPLSSDAFKMEVAFTGPGGTIKSLTADGTTGFAPVSGAPQGINFEGAFNDAGVMSGTTFFGFAGTGSFSGLIGAKGAVGVFRGGDNADGYAGGFVVKPPSD